LAKGRAAITGAGFALDYLEARDAANLQPVTSSKAGRLRLLVAIDRPAIHGYDQDQFARRLHYDRPTEGSLEAFKAARRSTAELLDVMTEEDWMREGTHTEHGRYTVTRWLEIYADHAHKHAEQILVARDAARKKGT
jgi:hypothetical protein